MSSAVAKTTATVTHDRMANAIRTLAMDAVEKAKSGHPGMPMGMADVATVLYTQFLRFDPKHPNWPDRDRFVLSAGHGSMLQYALHYLTGFADMTLEEIKNFRQWGAKTAGHPEYGHAEGIETTTGPLGQGIANAVGMAMAERALNAEFGDDLVNHFTYVIAGDGCLMEGISHEAASLAGHMKLNKLIVLWDDNQICIDGPTSMTVSDDQGMRFKALGWNVDAVDGHDSQAIAAAIANAQKSDKPTMIACRTIIAKGAPTKAGKNSSHGAPLGAEEIAGSRKAYGWEHGAFEVPEAILGAWRDAAAERATAYAAWEQRFAESDHAEEFTARMQGDLGGAWTQAITDLKKKLMDTAPKEGSRISSQNVLEAIVPHLPALFGGSADLTGSNNTKTKTMTAFGPSQHPATKPRALAGEKNLAAVEPAAAGSHAVMAEAPATSYAGRYVYYGVREHGMAAAMNGIALHGGFIPYGGTFLVFTDYCRPSIRLSALMQQRVIYVMTHDSIGLGEDGPTHQPVEHLASLRAIPNLNVFRPADATETAECWQLAIASPDCPSVLALSRQALPHLRERFETENQCAKGAYVLRDFSHHSPLEGESNPPADSVGGEVAPSVTPHQNATRGVLTPPQGGSRKVRVVMMATGSETHLAVEAAARLEASGTLARVVSVPCLDLFLQQPKSYRAELLPAGAKRIVIEAGIQQGWDALLGDDGVFIGMKGFGASAPAEVLYAKFGITVDAVVSAATA